MSDISPTTVVRTRDRKSEPLGLHVVYTPPGPRTIDLIFVHGLGGTSRLSWSYDRNLANFWPKEWLPLEPGFKDARILTFGYNANFMSQTKDLFNISDFAKDLLLQLKVGMDENVVSLEIGKVPIIFVVHSMGGLVVKKAYILGTQDVQYRDILDNVRGIVFLATPHRGSNLADMLNTLLSATFQSPKQYVTDLHRNSARISDINDQFRLYADKLELVSFFETMPTSVGIKKVVCVHVLVSSAFLSYHRCHCSLTRPPSLSLNAIPPSSATSMSSPLRSTPTTTMLTSLTHLAIPTTSVCAMSSRRSSTNSKSPSPTAAHAPSVTATASAACPAPRS